MSRLKTILFILIAAFIILEGFAIYEHRHQVYNSTYDVQVNVKNVDKVKQQYHSKIDK
jgi:hypothetical protein